MKAFSELTWNHRETTPLIDQPEGTRCQCKHKVMAIVCTVVLLVSFSIWGPDVLVRWREAEQSLHREEEARQRLGLHWGALTADSHCTAHNTREYWARLLNAVPYNYNWLKPCEDIPIDIHDRSIKTTRCYINPHVRSFIGLSEHKDDD